MRYAHTDDGPTVNTISHKHAPDAFATCGVCFALAVRAERGPVVRASGTDRAADAPVCAPVLPIATDRVVAHAIVDHTIAAVKRARALTSDPRVILGAFESTQVKIGAPATAARSTVTLAARVESGEAIDAIHALDRDNTGALPRNRMRVRGSHGSAGPSEAPQAFPTADTVTGAREGARGKACADMVRLCERYRTSSGRDKALARDAIRFLLDTWQDDAVRNAAISGGFPAR